jgi:SAM-dependent methyltransferase
VRPYRTKTQHGKAIFGESWLYECDECGLVQTLPRPSLKALSDYYAVDYRNGCFAGADVADLSKFPKDNLYYYNRGQSIAELLKPHIQTDTPQILDIGAGFGHILYALGERYPQAPRTAIEFSEVCVEHLQGLGIEVYTDAVEESLPKIGRKFDVIILSHVFEHLLNPLETAELIREHLAPDGVLYIEVPNIPADSLLRYPDHVWAPRFEEPHISLFSVPTLRNTLETAGFDVLFCDTAGGEYKYISAMQFNMPHWRWFLQSITPAPVFKFLREQSFTKSMRVPETVPSFYEYGGVRIWIRSISKKSGA